MKLKIIVDVEDCPYKRKKIIHEGGGTFHKCKHPDGDGKCYSDYSRVYAVCPVAAMGGWCLND